MAPDEVLAKHTSRQLTEWIALFRVEKEERQEREKEQEQQRQADELAQRAATNRRQGL